MARRNAVLRQDDELLLSERQLRQEGFSFIAGVDEAGRGPLAGPVVAGACVLPSDWSCEMLNDSKKEAETCVILDLPKSDIKETEEFFCYNISNGGYKDISFSFDGNYKTPRVILRGKPADVFGLINEYYKSSAV